MSIKVTKNIQLIAYNLYLLTKGY